MAVTDLETLSLDRADLVAWYLRNRERSRGLFDLIESFTYYTRPIALRNPIVFYEGHLPAFSVIALLNRGLGFPGVDARLEQLFARGIDPDSEEAAVPRSGASTEWPARDRVLEFGSAADAALVSALREARFDESRPAMRRGQAIFTALEHEAMHQETLLYMWHRLPHDQKRRERVHTSQSGLPSLRYEMGPPPHQRRRLLARPGLTGLAQVSGRNAIPWSERIEIDVAYVERWTMRRDLAIMLRTALVVLRREGTYKGPRGGFDLPGPGAADG